MIEANPAQYMVVAFPPGTTEFSPSTRLAEQTGSVTIGTVDQDARGAASLTQGDGSQDYQSQHGKPVQVGVPFSIETFNDYLREGTEHFQVLIDENSYTGTYPAVVVVSPGVTTAIVDIEEGGEDEKTPKVTVDLEVDPGSELLEGTSEYAETVDVKILDPDGNVVFSRSDVPVDANGHWAIPAADLPAFEEGKDYTATAIAKNDVGDRSVPAVDIDAYDADARSDQPTVTVDLEVDPGAELLEGESTHAVTVDVRIEDENGNVVFSKENVPVDSDGHWHISALELPEFDQAVDYRAIAVAKNSDGLESVPAADIDAYDLEPTVTVDLEVDPGMEKLDGSATDAVTVDVVVKDADGNVVFERTGVPVDEQRPLEHPRFGSALLR